MATFTFLANSESDTDRFGSGLAALLEPGTLVALNGTLGAGKTRLVRAIASALDVPTADVVSPTFVLCHQYTSNVGTLFHLDAYRIDDLDQFCELGVDEMLDDGGIVFVEWANRVAAALPPERLTIEIDCPGDHTRTFSVTGLAPEGIAVLSALNQT